MNTLKEIIRDMNAISKVHIFKGLILQKIYIYIGPNFLAKCECVPLSHHC